MEFQDLIKTKEYDFLRTNDHIKDRIILLTVGGSYSYGTNVDGSNVDIRGCVLNSKKDILGLSPFSHFVDKPTDTTIYGFNQMIRLLIGCNPNVIELLGNRPELYLCLTKEGQALIDNRKLFLSKAVVKSFGGYAAMQLRRMENALAWAGKLPQARIEEHTLRALKRSFASMEAQHEELPPDGISMYLDNSTKEDFDVEVFADVDLKHYPARGLVSLIRNLNNVI